LYVQPFLKHVELRNDVVSNFTMIASVVDVVCQICTKSCQKRI